MKKQIKSDIFWDNLCSQSDKIAVKTMLIPTWCCNQVCRQEANGDHYQRPWECFLQLEERNSGYMCINLLTQVFHLLLLSCFHLNSPSFTASLDTLDILWPIGRLRTCACELSGKSENKISQLTSQDDRVMAR